VNVLDLFSGIGGISLGLERAGMRTVAFCERDEFCRAILRKHWPDVPCFDDIRSIDADGLGRLGRIDLVCGGFPCQPFSVAGKQEAQKDDRYLWPEMRRVIALARPAWVICENVTGLITLALDDVLADLEGIGYPARPFVIPACAVDAKHRRDRVWIIATDAHRLGLWLESGRWLRPQRKGSPEPRADGTPESLANSSGERRGEARELRRDESSEWFGGSGADVADARSARLQGPGHERGASSDTRTRQSLFGGNGDGRLWEPEPDVGRVANGVPARAHRIKALGNAVVPQIPEIIGRAIVAWEQAR
jgi:DNA (cytosine-5)-methyltransferase 1